MPARTGPGLGKADDIAEHREAGPSGGEVGGDMIGGEHRVAIEKQKRVAGGESGAPVADPGQTEAVVGLGGECHRKWGPASEVGDDLHGRGIGAVVGHHDFEPTIDPLLEGDRLEYESQVPRLLVGVDDQGDVGMAHVRSPSRTASGAWACRRATAARAAPAR